MERSTCQEYKSENIKKNKKLKVLKYIKVSPTTWVLSNKNKLNIGDDCDRQRKIWHASWYNIAAIRETGQQQ